MSDLNDLARRYIELWNEPDAERRRHAISDLFAPDAAHYTPTREFHGHTELEARVTTAHEQWVEPGEYVFRSVPNANGHHDTVRFNWEMVRLDSGKVESVGFDFLVLDENGLIRSDHQFLDR
ncbi:nuclear transport factor 2 family protein [Actinopolymorpha pittospori]